MDGTPHYLAQWTALRSDEARIGPANAPVEIIEFVDFECPFCKVLSRSLRRLMTEHPNDVSLTLIHFPIDGHKFARASAVAYECAKGQNASTAMYASLLDGQDSIGLRSFESYAARAGVPGMSKFGDCLRDQTIVDRVERDRQVGELIGVSATPTVVVNGWLLPQPPSESEFARIVSLAASGKTWSPAKGDTVTISGGLTRATLPIAR